MICDIEEREKPYHPSQLTRFRNRVGQERLERIIAGLVEELIQGSLIRGETVAMDATFIKTYSKRDSRDNRWGDARADGKKHYIEESAYPIHDTEGEIVRAILFVRDVTERELSEHRLLGYL